MVKLTKENFHHKLFLFFTFFFPLPFVLHRPGPYRNLLVLSVLGVFAAFMVKKKPSWSLLRQNFFFFPHALLVFLSWVFVDGGSKEALAFKSRSFYFNGASWQTMLFILPMSCILLNFTSGKKISPRPLFWGLALALLLTGVFAKIEHSKAIYMTDRVGRLFRMGPIGFATIIVVSTLSTFGAFSLLVRSRVSYVLWALCLFSGIYALILTQTRASWLVFLPFLILMHFLMAKKQRVSFKKSSLIYLLIFAAFFVEKDLVLHRVARSKEDLKIALYLEKLPQIKEKFLSVFTEKPKEKLAEPSSLTKQKPSIVKEKKEEKAIPTPEKQLVKVDPPKEEKPLKPYHGGSSSGLRLNLWRMGFTLFKEHPLKGVGAYSLERAVAYSLEKDPRYHRQLKTMPHFHSGLLQDLVMYGILGGLAKLLFYLGPAFLFLRRFFSSLSLEEGVVNLAGTFLCLSLFSCALVDYMMYIPAVRVFYLGLCALLLGLSWQYKSSCELT